MNDKDQWSWDANSPVRHPGFGRGRVVVDHGGTTVVRFGHGIEECERTELELLDSFETRLESGVWDAPLEVISRVQAEAIRSVNDAWGAFAPSRIELLPHQLWVCRQVTSDWPTRWLVADDVGLGKTVEAGMILSALLTRNRIRRVLILCPASLVAQWQQRMKQMFDIRFVQYSTEVDTAHSEFWGANDYVVASLHTLRMDRKSRQDRLLKSDPWDLLLVDEAHHLNADEVTGQTLGYRLIRKLVELQRVQSMLFFTGTPHRGKNFGFLSLLQLLRPDLFDVRRPLGEQLNSLPKVMIRNNKSNVTDLNGNRLFQPPLVHSQTYSYSIEEERFYELMTEFISTGRAYAARLSATQGRAVMLVLIAMQKLASSSVAAIRRTLRARLQLLETGRERLDSLWGEVYSLSDYPDPEAEDENDWDRLACLDEEISELTSRLQLMENEEPELRELLAAADEVVVETKLAAILRLVDEQLAGRSILFFTEYKATQSLLMSELMRRFGADCVTFINGDERAQGVLLPCGESVDLRMDRQTAAARFNSGAVQYLVSTEAAGEGIDLQERAFTLVHVDLPWNPMRMHQRVGRLNRYGQRKRVEVFTIRNPDTVESLIWEKLMAKLEQISLAHGHVMEEPEDLHQLVLGMNSVGYFQQLFAEGSLKDRGSLSGWFDQETGRFGGQDAVRTVNDLVGHVNRFDFGQSAAHLPRVDLADLQPFLEAALILNNRRLREAENGVSFLTPEAWRSEAFILPEYHDLKFDRRYRGSDASKRVVGAGHRVLEAALNQAMNRNAVISTLPPEVLSAPILVFRVHDRITGQAKGARAMIVGVEIDSAGSNHSMLYDWQLLQILNALPYRRSLMSDQPQAVHDLAVVRDRIERGSAYFEANLASVDHGFRRPQHELLAAMWVGARSA